MANFRTNRRSLLKGAGAGIVALGTPHIFTKGAWAQNFCNDPANGKIVFGFNVPQTGSYAEEGLEQLKAYELAVKHINGEGDGGMLKTLKPLALKGNGVLGRKVEYVTGDTQTNTDAARDGARRMIERDRAIMVTGSVTSGEAIAQQSLCQEMGVIYMSGLTHSNDTTGKDKRRYGFRHFFNAYQSGVAIAPFLAKEYGTDRRAYHLTADYTWGWTQEESIVASTEAIGWETVNTVKTPLASTAVPALRPQVRLGESVYVFGFPLTGILATSGNFTTGTVTAVSGLGDDTRLVQISAPVQPGNSGGPLLDKFGNVIGVIVSKLNALNIAATTQDIPQNVNFAIKTAIATNFLDASNVLPHEAPRTRELSPEAIADLAKLFTVRVNCN